MKKAALVVAGILFALVALAHLARLIWQFPLIVGQIEVPLTVNIIGCIVAILLCIWMFVAAAKKS